MFAKDQRDGNWGYNSAAKNEDEFLARLKELIDGIYEADFQGLLDAEHNPKMDITRIREIVEK